MSGGSLEYLYSKDPSELLARLDYYMDRILGELDRAQALGPGEISMGYEKMADGKNEYAKPIHRDPTDIERAAVALFRTEITKLLADANALFARVEPMCDVLQSIEWSLSCDSTPSGTLQSCERWLSKRIGVESIRVVLEEVT